jgi:hypothetical protein
VTGTERVNTLLYDAKVNAVPEAARARAATPIRG